MAVRCCCFKTCPQFIISTEVVLLEVNTLVAGGVRNLPEIFLGTSTDGVSKGLWILVSSGASISILLERSIFALALITVHSGEEAIFPSSLIKT